MCGIAGFLNSKSPKQKEKIIDAMLNKIIHRGPDSSGKYVDKKIALGFRRLSIIDLSDNGSQPMYNEEGNLVLVFNGEIYNYESIKKDLIKKGHIFKTKTDTEVILHGYEEYGEKIVDKLRGMFMFVIWDINKQELFAARDPFGIKPFYYAKMNKTLMFGSEIKSFLPNPAFVKEINKEALRPYLTFQYSVLNETFFKNVFKLEPGHYLKYKNDNLEINKYYEIDFSSKEKDFETYMKDIEKCVAESVEYHKISDVKVGSFLSGGIDSSYITRSLMPNKTFSVGFANKGFSEVDDAVALSKMLKIENINKTIDKAEFFKEISNVQYHSDEPHANLSAVPLYFLSKLAKEHVTVVLSGEGADELFGGYTSYGATALEEKYLKLPKTLRRSVGRVAKFLPKFHGRNFLTKNGLEVEDYYIGQAYIFDEKEAEEILKPDYQKSKTIKEITKPYFDKVKDKDDVTKMQYLDMHLWLPQDILLKADKMTMAHSLELRVPFLDKEVMNLASKIPTKYKISNNTTKYILRKTANKVLPDEWAKRPKIGFPVPFYQWIKEEKYYKKIYQLFKKNFVKEFFDQEQILKLLDDHYNNKKNNGRKIWTIYAFLLWYKVYFIDIK
jgi:asparagine synthase (glutamine-hydrolysing)